MKRIKYRRKTQDVFFKTVEMAKTNVLKKVILNKCKTTGDRSYTDQLSKLVAETDTHFQLIVSNISIGDKLFICSKSEYDFESVQVL